MSQSLNCFHEQYQDNVENNRKARGDYFPLPIFFGLLISYLSYSRR